MSTNKPSILDLRPHHVTAVSPGGSPPDPPRLLQWRHTFPHIPHEHRPRAQTRSCLAAAPHLASWIGSARDALRPPPASISELTVFALAMLEPVPITRQSLPKYVLKLPRPFSCSFTIHPSSSRTTLPSSPVLVRRMVMVPDHRPRNNSTPTQSALLACSSFSDPSRRACPDPIYVNPGSVDLPRPHRHLSPLIIRAKAPSSTPNLGLLPRCSTT
jgi:hypothetical protein